MKANAARSDSEPDGSDDPAPIKMSNQHTKLLGQARSEEPAPTELQDNTHAAPVCAP